METDYDALAKWAEEEKNITAAAPASIIAGKAAAEAGKMLLAGKPSLGHTTAQGYGRSPRRQVRLPHELNTKLDNYAKQHDITASQAIRTALEYFFDQDNLAA